MEIMNEIRDIFHSLNLVFLHSDRGKCSSDSQTKLRSLRISLYVDPPLYNPLFFYLLLFVVTSLFSSSKDSILLN